MSLKSSFLRNGLLAIFVFVFSYGLFVWENPPLTFNWSLFSRAITQAFLIGQIYFWLQTKYYKQLGRMHFLHWILYPIAFYIEAYQEVFDFLWFWTLLFVQLTLVLSYEQVISWRRIPGLKNLLIASMWFIQLNLIPGLAGHPGLLFWPYLLFYLALSLQVDIEDIDEDQGKIRTLASLLGKTNADYVVVFLLTLFAYYMALPWVWIMLGLLVAKHELRLPKGSYDLLLLVLGLYFLFMNL